MSSLTVQQLVLRERGAIDVAMAFTVRDGEVGALFGRPHSGVREVLRAIAGLDRPLRGEVRLGDTPVHELPPEKRGIGLVQRDSVLFPGTVEGNVGFGLKHGNWPKADQPRRIAEALEMVGMTGSERDRVEVLTDGERSRILLARAIAPRPAALLIEAPTWYVPEVDLSSFRSRLREVLLSLEIPVLIATTDLQDAVGIADSLHVMDAGRLRQSGVLSSVLSSPNSIEVAELVGYVTLLRGEVHEGAIVEAGAGEVALPEGSTLDGMARALAHPAAMLGVPWSSGLACGVSGRIERIRAVGPTHVLDLRVGDRTVEVRWEWDLEPPDAEEVIGIAVTPGTLRVFSEPGQPNHFRRRLARPPARVSDGPADAEFSEPESEGEDERAVALDADPTPATADDVAVVTPFDATHLDREADRNEPPLSEHDPDDVAQEEPDDRVGEDDDHEGEDVADEERDDDGVEVMAPWLRVSRRPGEGDEGAELRRNSHRGMPLN